MRLIYIDEAGTAAHEPVTVVVGIIVHADSQWRQAEENINRILDERVPTHLRENFIFHAKEVFSGGRQKHGERLLTAMLGEFLDRRDWQGPASMMTFSWLPNSHVVSDGQTF